MSEYQYYLLLDIIVTCVEQYCLYLFFRSAPKKMKPGSIYYFLVHAVTVGIVVVLSYLQLPVVLKAGIANFFFFLAVRYGYYIKKRRIVLYLMLNIFIIILCEGIVVPLWEYFNLDPVRTTIEGRIFIYLEVHISLRILHFLVAYLVVRFFIEKNKDLGLRDVLSWFFQMIGIWVAAFVVNRYSNTEDDLMALLIVVIYTTMLSSLVWQITSVNRHMELKRKKRLEALSVHELQMKKDYYEKKMADEQQIRGVYHDLKNHLLCLEEGAFGQERREIVRQLRTRIEGYGAYVRTGNEFLDIILKEKAEKAREYDIDLEVGEICHEVSFMKEQDLLRVLETVLEEGMRCSRDIQKELRRIKVSCFCRKSMLFVVVKYRNSFPGREPGTHFFRWKSNGGRSGNWLKELQRNLSVYDGECTVQNMGQESVFTMVVPMVTAK